MSLAKTSAIVAASGALWLIYKLSQVGKREPDLPPGPPTVPLLGNLHLLPKQEIYLKFTEWAKEYGEIYSLKFGSGTVVVITSAAGIREVLDKNSALTSDRRKHHIGDVVTGGRNLVGAQYNGPYWRKLRRAAHEILMPQACDRHLPIQQAEATQLMHDLLTQPQNFYNCTRRFSFSVILSVLFGKRTPQYSTHEVTSFFHVQHLWGKALEPGAQPPIDRFPILKIVPERFAPWRTLCKEIKRLQRELYFGLLGEVEDRTTIGQTNGCFMETVRERAEEWKLDKELIGYLGGVILEAGSDTTSAALQTLILALVAHPEVQKKAQEEIDRVIGTDRAPTIEDVERLPYVQAIIKETFRFRPVAPLGIPHYTTDDVTYKGYRIPSGTTVFMNIWGIFHDENVYENEASFQPDRYLRTKFGTREEVVQDYKDWRDDFQFGSGRRICPGMHLAKNAMAINAVNFLWGFDFGKQKDPNTGIDLEADVWNYARGLVIFPNPFKCTITPRSSLHAEIIRQQFAEATSVFSMFEHEISEGDRQFVTKQRKGH